jgi:murein DD-endopeptidase MepM/ murein hydrolase activator NlpD
MKSSLKKHMSKLIYFLVSITISILLTGCFWTNNAHQHDVCSSYSDHKDSYYILPYAKGEVYSVIQGNCTLREHPWTHYGNLKYAYDFGMPVGTTIIAARAGTVVFVRDNFTDNDHGKNQGNAIVLLHEDGTYALYAHITNRGSKVKVGQIVKQGDRIALSGNSGESPIPHLHFQVNECGDFSTCQSMPVSFRNARPQTVPLVKDMTYTAE